MIPSLLETREVTAPSIRASLIKIAKTSVAAKQITTSLERNFFWTVIGVMTAAAQRISKIFAILLPKTFPMVIPVAP